MEAADPKRMGEKQILHLETGFVISIYFSVPISWGILPGTVRDYPPVFYFGFKRPENGLKRNSKAGSMI